MRRIHNRASAFNRHFLKTEYDRTRARNHRALVSGSKLIHMTAPATDMREKTRKSPQIGVIPGQGI
ncbi:hypothetical protein THPR109532_18585 [Thalassospira profundimaris]|nr:hypothetical protein TH2_04938 [Thalassospira profundimaris WP0211]